MESVTVAGDVAPSRQASDSRPVERLSRARSMPSSAIIAFSILAMHPAHFAPKIASSSEAVPSFRRTKGAASTAPDISGAAAGSRPLGQAMVARAFMERSPCS
jgi:hypothetical protein